MKSKIIGVIVIAGCLIFGICFYLYSGSDDFSFIADLVYVDDKAVKLGTGDIVSADYWNEKEVYYNDDEVRDAKFSNGIGIGSHIDEVEKKFNLNEDNCYANMEIPVPDSSGVTDIVSQNYVRSETIDKYDYLDCYLYFGFERINDEWVPLDVSTVKRYLKKSRSTKDVIIYQVGFNGFEDEAVGIGEIIAFEVKYYR